MNQDNKTLHMTEIYNIVRAHGIPAGVIELYQEPRHQGTYLIDGKYLLKMSTSAIDEQENLDRVKQLQLVPKLHAFGSIVISDCRYHYIITDYVQGTELWSVLQHLTDKDKYNIGKEIAQFLNDLHRITDDYYDIGHYIPTVPRYKKSWQEGHLEYANILQKESSGLDLELSSKKIIAEAFDYIYGNIDALGYQAGAKLLHNDFHPKNIIVNEGRLAGVIDWECSQYGEADFELSHLFHWCIYPTIKENNLEVLLQAVVESLQITSTVPKLEKRLTIYQLEHEINQLIWRGKEQEEERATRINGWLNGKISAFL